MMSWIKKLLFILSLCIAFSNITAQTISFTAQSKNTVSVGERFNVTYNLNAQGTNFRGPQFNGFNVLSGPNPSTSTSVQIINGQMTQSVNNTYTYILQAVKEGTYAVGAATVNVGGTDYQSNSLSINVVAGNQPPPQNKQTQNTNENEIFLKAFIDKSNPFQGEQIIVTYKIYTSIPVSQYTIDKLATFNGFWSESLTKDNDRPKQSNEIINGVNYTVAEIYKVALFPQRSGNLNIEPLGVEAVVQKRVQRQRQSVFDDFFFNPFESVQNIKLNLKSNSLNVKVKPLPTQNRTADFSGSVGSFSMLAEIDNTDLKVNDAATLKIKISGKGNLKMIEEPKINFPPNLETYAPKLIDNIVVNDAGISGSRTYEYLIIPRSGGDFKINPYVFSFFNPKIGKYESLATETFNLYVEKTDGNQTGTAVNMVSREDVKYIGSDIRFVKSNIMPLRTLSYSFYSSNLFLIMLLIPLFLFILFLIIWRHRIKLNNNTALLKNRKANKIAQKRLKQASSYMRQQKDEYFYDEVSKALWGYLNFKFNIPFAELSKEIVKDTFINKKIPNEFADSLISVLDECEFARFAPGDKIHNMEKVYKDAIQIIMKIEKVAK